jgi:hypothetical protein
MAKPGGDPSSGISLGDALILPKRHPACRRREAQLGSCTERENLSLRCQGRHPSGAHHEDQSTDAEHRDGAARSRDEGSVMEPDRRSCVVQPTSRANRQREEPADKAKPFDILKREVWKAFNRDSPTDDPRAGVHIGAFPAFQQDRCEVWTATSTSGSPNGGRASNLAIFAGIWTHGSRRLLLNP